MPESERQLFDAAIAAHQAGDLGTAAARYRALLAQAPEHYDALRLLGIVDLQRGDLRPAERSIRAAIDVRPESAEAWCNLASVLRAGGDLDAAAAALRRGLECEPGMAAAHNNLGNLLREQGDDAAAIEAYTRAIETAPADPSAYANRAAAQLDLGRSDEALDDARAAVRRGSGIAESHALLATVHHARGETEHAQVAFRQALATRPGVADWHYGLGLALDDAGDWGAALREYRRAVELDPGHIEALGQALFLARRLACWHEVSVLAKAFARRVSEGSGRASPFVLLSGDADAATQLSCARAWSRRIAAHATGTAPPTPLSNARPRVGFLSNGFGAHPTGALTVELFERLADARFDTYAFATSGEDGSGLRARLRKAFHSFEDLTGADWRGVHAAVRSAGIDLLVDLRGYGGGAVSEVFAARAAPVQVNWLAYPGTLGAPYMDHIIADPWIIPEGDEHSYDETVQRMPVCYQPVDTRREIDPLTPSRSDCGLPDEAVVLACFNNSYKITPTVFDIWMRTLAEVPDSVLWLLDVKPTTTLSQDLRAEAAARGVDPERLVFMPKMAHASYLARYRVADLFVDTFPYTAHTTASDALFVGCPVLTCSGDTFAARAAGSIVRAAGAPGLVCDSLAEYAVRLRALAADRDALAAERARLAAARGQAALFDGAAYARDFEALLLDLI